MSQDHSSILQAQIMQLVGKKDPKRSSSKSKSRKSNLTPVLKDHKRNSSRLSLRSNNSSQHNIEPVKPVEKHFQSVALERNLADDFPRIIVTQQTSPQPMCRVNQEVKRPAVDEEDPISVFNTLFKKQKAKQKRPASSVGHVSNPVAFGNSRPRNCAIKYDPFKLNIEKDSPIFKKKKARKHSASRIS